MYTLVHGSRVSSPYLGGFRSTGGHSGIDFAAPSGTPIRAAASGIVISAGRAGAYGNLVKVRHNDGSIAYYAHQSSIAVSPGRRVTRGSVIGRVGSTGNSTGPHLHFEVRQDGRPVNPTAWLSGDGGGARGQTPGLYYDIPQNTNTSSTTTRDNADLLAALEEPEAPRPALSTEGGGFLLAAPLQEEDLEQDDNPLSLDNVMGEEAKFRQRQQEDFDFDPFDYAPRQTSTRNWSTPAMSMPGAAQQAGGGNAFNRLLNAIAGQESGNNYGAVNRSSGALGKYQIMPGNIAGWSKAALGYTVTPSQFLRDPGVQDRIARHRMGTYYSKYGAAGAALAWYAGEGALKYSSSAKNRSQGAYPSMNSYVQQVLRRAGL